MLVCSWFQNAILVGRKQHKDITFYTEIGEVQTDLSMSRFQRSERDEYEQEQRERRVRKKLKQLFRKFFEQVERETDGRVQFEVPNWELGFPGEFGGMQREGDPGPYKTSGQRTRGKEVSQCGLLFQ